MGGATTYSWTYENTFLIISYAGLVYATTIACGCTAACWSCVYYNHGIWVHCSMLVLCIYCIPIGLNAMQLAWHNSILAVDNFFKETMERINTSTYEANCTVDDKPCKVFIKIKTGSEIWSIYDQDNVDITDDILPYFST